MNFVFHGSSTPNLRVLKPNKSTHMKGMGICDTIKSNRNYILI